MRDPRAVAIPAAMRKPDCIGRTRVALWRR